MSHPSFAEYTDALRLDLGSVLSDPLLARGRLLTHGPGQPVAFSGNFALTFVVEVDGRKYALRCFHKPAEGLRARYEAISRHLKSISSPYLVDFEFQPAGIRTESGSHPVVRMEWAEGQTLGAFVADHHGDSNVLLELRDTLRRLAANLGVCGIAHGDVQPSNIIVDTPTRLKLIDYDGMYVPALRSLGSTEIGQRNFQHPGRQACHFDERLDAFSFAVLDVTLDALSRRPELWEATGSGDDAIVLRAHDFADPANSSAFRALAQVPRLERRVKDLAAICASPFESMPGFGDFLAGRGIADVSLVFSGDPTLPLRRRYVSPHAIVDAGSFARLCSHVGDRVELIGQVVRVVRSHTPRFASTYLRVEFDERGRDMACLKIWPDAESSLDEVPDASWAGQWVRAVGLVEPVARGHSGSLRQRDVSISITERAQLQRITETEARYRLKGRRAQTRPTPDSTWGVRTDPVVADAAPRLKAVETRRPHGGTRPAQPRTRRPAPPQPAATVAVPPDMPELSIELEMMEPVEAPPTPTVRPLPVTVAPASAPANVPVSLRSGKRGPHRAGWFAAALVATLAAASFFATMAPREPAPAATPSATATSKETSTADLTDEAVRPDTDLPRTAEAPPLAAQLPAGRVAVRLESEQSLRGVRLPILTAAGSLRTGEDGSERGTKVLTLDGTPVAGLRDDAIVLVHRARYSDREIIVGYSECRGTAPPCGLRKPFWLLLRATHRPVLRTAPDVWASSTAGSVQARDADVRMDLGVWNGARGTARLTIEGELETSWQPAPIRALNRADCALVAKSLEACAASRDCRSFASSAQRIPGRVWSRLTGIYHEKTGLDAAAFRTLCVRSCELGLTPSAEFIRRNACSGARRGQWPEGNPAAGLIAQRR